MSTTDEVLRANEAYIRKFDHGKLNAPPVRRLAILACMDARLTIEQIAGLVTGNAHIIRNASGVGIDAAIRSMLISHYLTGHQRVANYRAYWIRNVDLQGRRFDRQT
jgi:carbonic anhydrase